MVQRILNIAVLVLPLGLVATACSAPASAPMDPGSSLSGRLTGNVTYRERIALDPGAEIEVQLLDISKADASAEVIATQTIPAEGRQVPIPFELAYDPARIDERFRYAVRAQILANGQLRWTSQETYPVLTQGNPTSDVEIVVRLLPAEINQLIDQE